MENNTDQTQSPEELPAATSQQPVPTQTATTLPNLPNSPNSPNPPIQKTHHFPLHKILLIIAIVLTIVFTTAYIGVYYLLNQQLDKLTNANKAQISPTPPISQTSLSPTPTSSFPVQEEVTPTCTPRPACLDSTPRCMIPETADMCPKATPTGVNQTACTLEAKLCSDGTYVSRQPPTCEFAACP